MCGITGIIDMQAGVSASEIDKFNYSLFHRGPDYQAVYLSPRKRAALGHCRLSILDMTTSSHQPFKSSDGRYILVFNGEIYNFIELKSELKLLGHEFFTTSDTEVLLHAYLEWGTDCLSKFNGMWAFAIWDDLEQSLFLSRDRFGVKSLYFQNIGCRFAFASEQKAFISLKHSVSIDPDNLNQIISFPEVIESQRFTIYRDVQKLLPGEYAFFKDGKLQIYKWWDTYSELKKLGRNNSGTEELQSIFHEACEIRTRSDAKVATALSGGIDSSVITSQIAKHSKPHHEMKAFIGSFDDLECDEFKWAEQVCKKNNISFVRVNIDQEDVINSFSENALCLEDINELPAIGQSKIYAAMREQGYKVSIEGHGGDELFGGYPRHINAYMAESIYNGNSISDLANGIISLSNTKPLRNNAYLKGNILQLSTDPQKLHMKGSSSKLYLRRFINSDKDPVKLKVAEVDDGEYLSEGLLFRKLYEDFHYLTLPYILRNYDRLSMKHGIEVRSPFLDYRFVLAAFRAPQSFKISEGKTKRFLRDGLIYLPEQIANRTDKSGFTPPMISWLKAGLAVEIQERLNDIKVRNSTTFDGVGLINTINELIKRNSYSKLLSHWPLINIALLESSH
ncbi:asparagine synthase [Catenovulum agarivorans DS-2]|uniref:asparagine synthase (glutamine-hydrolyzing) n=1 Tax=Catenovulum agarivorans DS-2 TaxID=1328313 RepID=W7QNK0_9ALTE|nr:asparagine synthase (glutamine-hydrolyzing) [Catenovulum agarivorans]EWH09488.1 asparagine synthase [Catenovulum agarivorans DS-2]